MFPTQFIQLDGQAVKSVALFPICRLDDVSLGEPEPDLLLQVWWLHGGVTAVNKTNSNEIKKKFLVIQVNGGLTLSRRENSAS